MGNKASSPTASDSNDASGNRKNGVSSSPPRARPVPKGLTLLRGCVTLDEHEDRIRRALRNAADGGETAEGDAEARLRACGFEFRFVPCAAHRRPDPAPSPSAESTGRPEADDVAPPPQSPVAETNALPSPSATSGTAANSPSAISPVGGECDFGERRADDCRECATRLFHVGSQSSEETSRDAATVESKRLDGTMITPFNRKQFIADGAMYELVANLAQQVAQSKMCTSFGLEWATVCDEPHLGECVRALVDRDHPSLQQEAVNRTASRELSGIAADEEEKKDDASCHDARHQSPDRPALPNAETKPTLLVATGRGKVRAGVFSRHHLLTAGLEMGTSWHFIREARERGWGVAVVDPNARGEEAGYESLRRSVSRLFDCDGAARGRSLTQPRNVPATSSSERQRAVYVLAHSASGGQLVRHLREDPALLPSMRAIAFTDSTHNVQWCKRNPDLGEFLQGKKCVYLRSNDVRSSQSCVKVSSRGKEIRCDCVACAKAAGSEAETDHFWEHRFGRIKTLWAGTSDHSLSNWAGHESIWDHFDEHVCGDNYVEKNLRN